ncbi:hypothetical protein B0H13DRAFT_1881133 [Mycena leptocephala]|nr:hypothetical protein B0H13DRAFT_1881133 [Mycena leptocephala]
MFSTKSLLAIVSTAMFIGTASAFTGTANLGFSGTTVCACPPFNGPFAVAIPSADVGTKVCCNDQITITFNDKTTTAVFSGIYNAGAGTDNIALSPDAFAALGGAPEDISHSPVTWSFL